MIKSAQLKAVFQWVIIGVLFSTTGVFAQENIIRVEAGRQFVIKLESNPTTGYNWQLSEIPDPSMLEFIRQGYILPQNKLIGAGGQEEWVFKALKPGKIKILFKYVRAWEKEVAAEKTESFLVIVK